MSGDDSPTDTIPIINSENSDTEADILSYQVVHGDIICL